MATGVNVGTIPGGYSATWSHLGGAESGQGVSMTYTPDKTVQVSGTFGGATVKLQGSNDDTNWFDLTKPGATAISFTDAGGAAIVETPRYIRPVSTGGTASDIQVSIVGTGR